MMADVRLQKVCEILQYELRLDAHYKELAEAETDPHFVRFRQDLDELTRRCFREDATVEHFRRELKQLQAACFGSTLAPFQTYLNRALAAALE